MQLPSYLVRNGRQLTILGPWLIVSMCLLVGAHLPQPPHKYINIPDQVICGTNRQSEERHAQHHQSLIEASQFLMQFDRGIKPINGDGNCLFRALSQLLFGTEELHPQIRDTLVQVTKANPDLFRKYCFPRELADHLKLMEYQREWGTQLEIHVAATILQMPIYVCTQKSKTMEYFWEVFNPRPNSSLRYTADIMTMTKPIGYHHLELCHSGRCHYDIITMADTTQPFEPPPITKLSLICDLT